MAEVAAYAQLRGAGRIGAAGPDFILWMPSFTCSVLAAPQRGTEIDPLAETRFVLRIDNGPAGLGFDALPDIGRNERPARNIVDFVRLAFEHPEYRVASRMDEALERAAVPLQVDQHRRVHLIPIPGVVLMVLMERFDLAVIRIECDH